jgi:PPOX class probable F420-dependent enzyme
VVDGEDLVFSTDRDSLKGRNPQTDPRAALTVDREEFAFSFVAVHGPVRVEEGSADLLSRATRIAERYVPSGRAEDYGRRNAVPEELLCRLRLARVVGARDIAS